MTVLALIVVLASTVWVYVDAKGRDWTSNAVARSAGSWAFGTFALWLIVLPLYLVMRAKVPNVGQPSSAIAEPQAAHKTCPECAETIQGAARVCHFCGHRFGPPLPDGSVAPPATIRASTPPPAQHRGGSTRLVVLLVALAIVGVWSTGAADRPLSDIGLNRNPCIVNGFGAKFCGQDAKDYCERVERVVGAGRAGDCADIADS